MGRRLFTWTSSCVSLIDMRFSNRGRYHLSNITNLKLRGSENARTRDRRTQFGAWTTPLEQVLLRPMAFREPRLASKQSRAPMTLVARGLLALLFTFYVYYIPFHLLSERHCAHSLSSQISAAHFDDH